MAVDIRRRLDVRMVTVIAVLTEGTVGVPVVVVRPDAPVALAAGTGLPLRAGRTEMLP